ncbi:hypothetical protein L2E82_51101 [Cichorium intybus]|nr:hypothetical protein L2E82_51101 [Cichorium intybus]
MDARKRGRPQANVNDGAKKSKSASQSRNYRVWTNTEETKLVKALVNMANTGGFKDDKGFKAGYLSHLEQVLKESLPKSGILGKPHIESKIKVMKKDWQVVHDILNGLNTNGFNYDSVRHCLIADDQVWDSYLETHEVAAKWRNKTFHHYEDLCIVFGKDVNEGNKVRDIVEIEELEEQTRHLGDDSDNIVTSSHIPPCNENMQFEETSSAYNDNKKARVDVMTEGFSDAFTCLVDTMKKIANKVDRDVKREEELDKKRSMITCEISKMQLLTQSEKFKAITRIRENPEKVKIFWELQEMDRGAFVKWVLEE